MNYEIKKRFFMVAITNFEKAIEKVTGESVDSLRDMSIDKRRQIVEKKHNQHMLFPSLFPLIGRGSVLRDCTVSRKEIEAQLDEVLR
jgi:hypothetical protein